MDTATDRHELQTEATAMRSLIKRRLRIETGRSSGNDDQSRICCVRGESMRPERVLVRVFD